MMFGATRAIDVRTTRLAVLMLGTTRLAVLMLEQHLSLY